MRNGGLFPSLWGTPAGTSCWFVVVSVVPAGVKECPGQIEKREYHKKRKGDVFWVLKISILVKTLAVMNFDALEWRYIENEIGLIRTLKTEIGAVGIINVKEEK